MFFLTMAYGGANTLTIEFHVGTVLFILFVKTQRKKAVSRRFDVKSKGNRLLFEQDKDDNLLSVTNVLHGEAAV